MSVAELQWLKENLAQLSEQEQQRLEELHMVGFIQKGEVRIPLSELVEAMEEASQIISKYMQTEENL